MEVGGREREKRGRREITLAVLLGINLKWRFFLRWPSLSLGKDLPLGFF